MIELRQNKIWSDSLNSTLEFDQSWNYVDRGLHKFICFGEGGDSGGAGSGGGGVEAYGPQAAQVAAELGSLGFGLGLDEEDVFGPPPSVTTPAQSVDPFGIFAPPQDDPLPPMAELNIAPAFANVVAPIAAALTPDEPTVPAPLGYAPSVLDPDMMNPNIVSTPTDEMIGFGPVSRADIASVPALTSEVYPGFSLLGLNTGVGRGMFGGYTSTDAPTAQADVDQGYATSEVGSFDPLGILGGLAKGVASAVVPGLGLVANVAQQASLPPGMSDINALSNVLGSDRGLTEAEVLGAPTAAPSAPPPAPDPFSVGFSNFGNRDPRIEELPVRRAQGGLAGIPYFEGRVMPTGDPKEDGMSDNIPFVIAGQEGGQMGMQPAILSPDEYVIPADVVSMLGNGSSTAGSNQLDQFISNFRMEKYGRPKQPPEMRGGLSSLA